MSRKFLLTLSCALLFTVLTAQNYVTLYEDCNYRGRSYFLEAGTYRGYQMKISNDRLSSMQVPAGMKVTIYEHDNYSGRSKTFLSNTYCLDESWNDMASSIVVEGTQQYQNPNDYIVFYNDCYSKGYSRSLGPGTYSGNDLGILKNNISSFMIYGNLRLRVYTQNDNTSGYYADFEQTQNCLTSSFNDKIKSLVIESRGGGGYGNGGYNNNYGGNNSVTVYTECNYRGNSLKLKPGYYEGDKLGLLKYDISSIEIPSNLVAKVYVNNDYLSGSYYTLSDNTNCMSSTLNNRIGSLIIEEKGYNNNNNNYPPDANQRVILYVDEDYKGQSVSLLPGTYSNMAQIGFPDNAMSSLTVPEGYRVVIYDNENFTGKSYTITASKNRFYLSGWSDKTSSIAVYRDR
ncbi:MAG TPA: peptidase inhibitor family I36 protein [Chitinophagaceae bacterium]|nr:peptidase inhibitor family I36 protein [Chitinophagaceae bacterium]